jgi:hypothetical protein
MNYLLVRPFGCNWQTFDLTLHPYHSILDQIKISLEPNDQEPG